MFWGCFTYNHKGPCHIYYPKTADQKQTYKDAVKILNKEELEAKCQAEFAQQEKDKEAKWTAKNQKFLSKRASQEVYQKTY